MISAADFPDWLRVDPATFQLSEVDTRQRHTEAGQLLDKEQGRALHAENVAVLKERQFLLAAERRRSVLIVLQATDAGGKDGTIRRVFGPLNPQGVNVKSFKVPTERELHQDFLWRVHQHCPPHGRIQIFNRSHYEDVLVVRVHNMVPEPVWRARYNHINNFERLLADNDTIILKFLLHISKEEQRERLQERLDNPDRHWKFSRSDVRERRFWDDYQQAFNEAVINTSTDHAPWYVIPADRKWFRNYCVSTIVRQVLEAQDMAFPPPESGVDSIILE